MHDNKKETVKERIIRDGLEFNSRFITYTIIEPNLPIKKFNQEIRDLILATLEGIGMLAMLFSTTLEFFTVFWILTIIIHLTVVHDIYKLYKKKKSSK